METPQLVLQEGILGRIKSDAILFGLVAKSLKVSPSSLPGILNKNDPKLTQATTLKIIKNHTNCDEGELLTEETPAPATV